MSDEANREKHTYTALVVDDDEDTVNLFTEFLEIYDVAVVGKAFDGRQAAQIFQDMSPDIIFSDVMMPEYDGFYALENIKKIKPQAIMVMITGDVRADTIHKLEKLGADAIIYKPFDMQSVMKTVNNLLAKTVCPTSNT
ncbi:CheY-like receiver [Nitrosotalea devaniterrae]|uniref:CheY-like receiver n=1 Tax=Nitrosotalea devaniterrae TaxID=1078905 RepID=A0A128A321_9ARCH|nr:CheY-like receiver [Candidatus Nitrosotalea devanaterra]